MMETPLPPGDPSAAPEMARWFNLLTEGWIDPSDLGASLDRIAVAASKAFEASLAVIYAVNPITGAFVDQPGRAGVLRAGEPDSVLKPPREDGFTQGVLRQGFRFIENLLQLPLEERAFCQREGIKRFAAVALNTTRQLRPFAVLYLDYRDSGRFGSLFEQRLRDFSRVASRQLEVTWLLRRYRRVMLLGRRAQTVSSENELFRSLFSHLLGVLDAKKCFLLALRRPEQGETCVYVRSGGTERSFSLPGDRGFDWLIGLDQTLRAPLSGLASKRWQTWTTKLSLELGWVPRSFVVSPIRESIHPLGLLAVLHPDESVYDEQDASLLQIVAGYAGLALANLRLVEHLRRVSKVGRTLTQGLESGAVLATLCAAIRDATGCDLAMLYSYAQASNKFTLPPETSGALIAPGFPQPSFLTPDSVAALSIKVSEPLFVRDSHTLYSQLGGTSNARYGAFEIREQIRSTALVALTVAGEKVGVLFLNFRAPQRFDEAQRQLVEGLAEFAAIAIKNAREFGAQRGGHVADLETLQSIDRELGRLTDLGGVLQRVLELAAERLAPDSGTLYLYDKERSRLVQMARIGLTPKMEQANQAPSMPVAEANELVQKALLERRPQLAGDVLASRWSGLAERVDEATRCVLAVPLFDPESERVLGALQLESQRPEAFSLLHQQFIITLAGQAVLAVQKAQAYEHQLRLAQRLRGLAEVASRVVGQLDSYDGAMRAVVEQALRLTRASMADLDLYEGDRWQAHYRSIRIGKESRVEIQFQDIQDPLVRPPARGIMEHVGATRQPLLVKGDAELDPLYKGDRGIHSELAIPLESSGQLLGILDVTSDQLNAFGSDEQELLTLFGSQAVLAIENGRNYAEAERSLKRLHLLQEVGRVMASLSEASHLREAYELVLEVASGQFRSAVVVRRFEPQTGELVREAFAKEGGPAPFLRIPPADSLNGRCARERRTINEPDVLAATSRANPDHRSDPTDRAFVITPIQIDSGSEYYGNLALSHPEAAHFRHADVALIEGLAQQLAITIRRLEEVEGRREAERRAQEAEAVTEIGQIAMDLMHRLGSDLGQVPDLIDEVLEHLVERGLSSNEVQDKLVRAAAEVGAILELSDGLGDAIARGGGVEPAATELRELVELALGSLHRDLALPELRIEKTLPFDPVILVVDAGQVTEALLNLLRNSSEAMPEGGTLEVGAELHGEEVQIWVRDTGCGIGPEELRGIYGLGRSTKPRGKGYGLWSVRLAVRRHRGTIAVQSALGTGTCFRITLPVAPESTRA